MKELGTLGVSRTNNNKMITISINKTIITEWEVEFLSTIKGNNKEAMRNRSMNIKHQGESLSKEDHHQVVLKVKLGKALQCQSQTLELLPEHQAMEEQVEVLQIISNKNSLLENLLPKITILITLVMKLMSQL